MSMQFYSILRSILISLFWPGEPIEREKEWGEGGRRKHHFREMRQPSAMPADDCDSGTAQILGNGGKMEPYTIIIMINWFEDTNGLFIYWTKTCLRGKTPPRLGHLAPASEGQPSTRTHICCFSDEPWNNAWIRSQVARTGISTDQFTPNVQSGAATYSIGCVIITKYLSNIGQIVYAKLLAPPDCVFVKHWLRPSLKHKNL
jgi:hypothetical protein